ncbi:MAG TPA: NAD-dependent epimerase [Saprospiraceae bacterium]|nr:NAD-dependent epimerase [Lacibacter sp.]HMO89995.1 NAD-dependent epimerase [Lacibacter sp.]HMQ08606.1 NAD-dependent epimerase [Saprospiraceae bacterium]
MKVFDQQAKHVFITGTAGFIGFHLARKLLHLGYRVTGYDSINDYYDVNLKLARLRESGIDTGSIAYGREVWTADGNYRFVQGDLTDKTLLDRLFQTSGFDYAVNLAAQAGVRHSLTHPYVYTESNITGFLNILEACRHNPVQQLLYASSSSVYGLNSQMPLSEHQRTDHPMSLYAATKKANEMMAHSYSHLYRLPITGLRFFTVYGPWGRPDMALFLFTKAMLQGEPIQLFNGGEMIRDFTYVDDIVESISRLIPLPPEANTGWNTRNPDTATSSAPYRILNIGNSNPVQLTRYINAIEQELGVTARRNLLPMQPGDIPVTHADCGELEELTGYRPRVKVEEGVKEFVKWYRDYFQA